VQAARLDVQKQAGAHITEPAPVALDAGTGRTPPSETELRVYFLHAWFPRVHEVLHADWQEVWHSRQPPLDAVALRFPAAIVFTCTVFFSFMLS